MISRIIVSYLLIGAVAAALYMRGKNALPFHALILSVTWPGFVALALHMAWERKSEWKKILRAAANNRFRGGGASR